MPKQIGAPEWETRQGAGLVKTLTFYLDASKTTKSTIPAAARLQGITATGALVFALDQASGLVVDVANAQVTIQLSATMTEQMSPGNYRLVFDWMDDPEYPRWVWEGRLHIAAGAI